MIEITAFDAYTLFRVSTTMALQPSPKAYWAEILF